MNNIEKWELRIGFIKEYGVSKYNQKHKPVFKGFSNSEAIAYCKKQRDLLIEYESKEK